MKLIDSDALIKKLGISERFNADIPVWVIGVIKGMPSAERRGKWIELYDNNYKCSECGAWWNCEETPVDSGMNFCPNCGARMVEGEEHE